MNFVLRSVVLASAAMFCLSACKVNEPTNGVYTVRVPMDDGAGNYVLKNVELHSVTNLSRMEGTAAVIKNRGTLTEVMAEGASKYIEYNTGFTPNARFVKASGVYIASDYDSLLMATVMANFELLKDFFGRLNALSGISFPQRIMLNAEQTKLEDKVTYRQIDNASYWPALKLFTLNQSTRPELVPVSGNMGVLAHEYTHSVFNARVRNPRPFKEKKEWSGVDGENKIVNEFMDRTCAQYAFASAESDKKKINRANAFILSALDEGIADYFAYEVTGNPFWYGPTSPESDSRDVSKTKSLGCVDGTQAKFFASHKLGPHHVGVYFSHFLFLIAEKRKAKGDLSTPKQVIDFIDHLNGAFELLTKNGDVATLNSMAAMFISLSDKRDGAECQAAREIFTSSDAIDAVCKEKS